jgi:hypothetical protein
MLLCTGQLVEKRHLLLFMVHLFRYEIGNLRNLDDWSYRNYLCLHGQIITYSLFGWLLLVSSSSIQSLCIQQNFVAFYRIKIKIKSSKLIGGGRASQVPLDLLLSYQLDITG